jgi:putative transposase
MKGGGHPQADDKSRFSETQSVAILKNVDSGIKVAEVRRSDSISQPTHSSWKSAYGGLEVAELRRIRKFETEDSKLKRRYAHLAMENHARKERIPKEALMRRTTRDRPTGSSCSNGLPYPRPAGS